MSSEVRGQTRSDAIAGRLTTGQPGVQSLCLPPQAGTEDVLLPLSAIQRTTDASPGKPPWTARGQAHPSSTVVCGDLEATRREGKVKTQEGIRQSTSIGKFRKIPPKL